MRGFKKTHSFIRTALLVVTTAYFLFSGPMEYIVHTQAGRGELDR